jgi:CYTH domain-containing protein
MAEIITVIERRFLTPSNAWCNYVDPDLKIFITQAYPNSLQKDSQFGRVRSSWDHASEITVYEEGFKGISIDLKTPETEWEIDQARFNALLLEADSQSLIKWRWLVAFAGLDFVVDQFESIRQDHTKLVITKVEFANEQDAIAFQPPSWLGYEITGNHRWSNVSLCMLGEPLLTN